MPVSRPDLGVGVAGETEPALAFTGADLAVGAGGEFVPAPSLRVVRAPGVLAVVIGSGGCEDAGGADEVGAVLDREPGRDAVAVGVADTQQAPGAFGRPSADGPEDLRGDPPEAGVFDDAISGGNDHGAHDRGLATGADPEDAAFLPVASGPLDCRDRRADCGPVQLPDVNGRVRPRVHHEEPGVICSTRWK